MMANDTREKTISEMDRSKRKKRIQNLKTGGDILMYVGCAGLMMPMMQKAKEKQNSLIGMSAVGAGTILSIGLGKIASDILNRSIDKVVDFWDEVKPSGPAEKPTGEEKNNG